MRLRVEFENKSELDMFVNSLKNQYEITNISKEYPNRKPSTLIRVYIELKLKE